MKKYLSLFLSLCLILGSMGFAFADAAFTPGTYTGSAEGFAGDVKATVTVDENAITAIEITGDSETPGLGGAAMPVMQEAYIGKAAADAAAESVPSLGHAQGHCLQEHSILLRF